MNTARQRTWWVRLLVVLALGSGPCAHAVDQGLTYRNESGGEPLLQPYEPIVGGYSIDSDDAAYMDVTLSLKIRLLPADWPLPRSRLFMAMTTRFGFYWGTRANSPVIGKSYNPKLVWRYLPDEASVSDTGSTSSCNDALGRLVGCRTTFTHDSYIDLAYAHESNGQLIHTPTEYLATYSTLKDSSFVDQYIHRGWDYVEAVGKMTLDPHWRAPDEAPRRFAAFLDLKYFLPDGLLQGAEDQYHDWENNPQGKERKSVDGVTGVLEYPIEFVALSRNAAPETGRLNGTLKYQTGYDHPFRYSTVRAELGFQLGTLPLALWAQEGYMSDLAMYYIKVRSYGLELRVGGF